MGNHNDSDEVSSSESVTHGWNRRENHRPIRWYILLIVVCGGIAWILSTMGK